MAIALAVAWLASGCSRRPEAAPRTDDGLTAFVSIVPLVQIVECIGGPDLHAEALVGPGQSPHTFSITPGQIRRLSQADLFFAIGVDYELGALPRIRAACPRLKVVEAQSGIKPRSPADRPESRPTAHENGNGRGAAHDPHIWLDPVRVKQIATNICNALVAHDPAHADDYRKRLKSYLGELDALHAEIKRRLAPYAGRAIVVYHPAFGYFADRYGLREIAIEADGKAPGSQALLRVVEAARSDGVHTVFHEPSANVSLAEAVAGEIGGKAVALDPLAPDLLGNLRRIADAIAASFGDKPQ